MGFNLRVSLHVAGMLVTLVLLAWCVSNTRYYATMTVLSLLLVAQVAGLLRMLHSTNRELERFMQALHYMDFTQRFHGKAGGGSFASLGASFNQVLDRLRNVRSEREQQAAWLHNLVQHLPVAIVVLDENERVVLANTALQRLLQRNTPPVSLAVFQGPAAALAGDIRALQPGREQMHKLARAGDTLQLKLSCTQWRSDGKLQKLVCIQNIEGELEGRELDAWQNLIRVMTHEIMNSVTPLTSLAETAGQCVAESRSLLESGDDTKRVPVLLEDAGEALDIIGKRGQGLLRFVSSYRKLARVPKPAPAVLELRQVFHRLQELLADALREAGVELVCECRPANLQLLADGEQLDQALINLLRNALDAVQAQPQPQIRLRASLEEGGVIAIVVQDNGCGIAAEHLDSIFVPFFTTKRNGSGIGMSLVKQIVRANGGRIGVDSTSGVGTTVRLTFRQY